MKPSCISSVCPPAFAVALIIFGMGPVYAQVPPGGGSSIIGQPPGRSSNIIGQPPRGQSGMVPFQPNYPASGSTGGRDVTKDALDRATRDAADINLDGRIDPAEAARMPGGTLSPGTPRPR
ncbi:MAG TPA: hypothetical protein VF780_10635 [Nitrosospira sp.]